MSLERLFASRFRNLQDIQLDLNPGINFISGKNGSGKTSLLEAAHFLSSGRSFRTLALDPVIQKGSDDCLVRGELKKGQQRWQIGILRNRNGERDIRINGETCSRASELAEILPTRILGPESVDLLLGPPDPRRRFLNWGLFHVEQGFVELWEAANRCLRQRNRLLREGDSQSRAFKAWSFQLAEHALRIHCAREQYLSDYRPIFKQVVESICQLNEVDISYSRGWPENVELFQIYENEAQIDEKRGFTQKGFQRADVRITVNGDEATKICSRGELKGIVWSLILAQGELNGEQNTLYLIDDLASEFDIFHRRRVGSYLAKSSNQALVTGLDSQILVDCCKNESVTMFHVEHGQIVLS